MIVERLLNYRVQGQNVLSFSATKLCHFLVFKNTWFLELIDYQNLWLRKSEKENHSCAFLRSFQEYSITKPNLPKEIWYSVNMITIKQKVMKQFAPRDFKIYLKKKVWVAILLGTLLSAEDLISGYNISVFDLWSPQSLINNYCCYFNECCYSLNSHFFNIKCNGPYRLCIPSFRLFHFI